MTLKGSVETKWDQVQFNLYKNMQTKKHPIASDSKHDGLFHMWLIPNLQKIEQDYKKEDLAYKQVENLIKRSK